MPARLKIKTLTSFILSNEKNISLYLVEGDATPSVVHLKVKKRKSLKTSIYMDVHVLCYTCSVFPQLCMDALPLVTLYELSMFL